MSAATGSQADGRRQVGGLTDQRHESLAGRIEDGTELFMSGGVALNRAMTDALSQTLGRRITVLPEPQLVGALGAALAVKDRRQ